MRSAQEDRISFYRTSAAREARPGIRLRAKTLCLFGATLVGLMIVFFGVTHTRLLGDFLHLEDRLARERLQRGLAVIDNRLDAIDTTAHDWAAWDDTYQFIRDGNRKYTEANFQVVSIANLKLNYLIYLNATGKVVAAKAVDFEAQKEVSFPPEVLRLLTTNPRLAHHADTKGVVKTLVDLPQGPLLVVSRPILTSEAKGPIRGTLMMARYLDDRLMQQMGQQMLLSLSIQRVKSPNLPPDFKIARQRLAARESQVVRPVDEKKIASYALLKDVNGAPFLILRVDAFRAVYQNGLTSARYVLWTVVAASIVFLALMLFLLEKMVLSRLARLEKDIRHLSRTGDITRRIPVEGNDEFAAMSGAINRMLSSLEESEHALIRSEARLRAAQRQARLGCWEMEPESRTLLCSEEMRHLYGFDTATAPPDFAALCDRIHPEDRERVVGVMEAAIAQQQDFQIDYRIVLPDEAVRHLHAVGDTVRDGGGRAPILVGIVLDITEMKRTEERLRQSREQYELAVQGAQEGIWDWDIASDAAYLSPLWKRMLGYEDQEIENSFNVISHLLHPEDRDRVIDTIQMYLLNLMPDYSAEFRMRHKDGSYRWILARGAALRDAQGNAYRMAGSHTDITQRKEAEAHLLMLSLVAEKSLNGILITDVDERILYVNPAMEAMTGYTFAELQGQRPGKMLQGVETDAETRKTLRRNIAARQPVEVSILNYRKDGSPYWTELHIAPVINAEGNPTHFVAMANDITRRKHLEDSTFEQMLELSRARLALEEQQQALLTANIRLQALAKTDGLTGLNNHRAFQEQIEMEVQRAARQQSSLSLLLLDVDHFKRYNDTFGHPAGDEVLKRFARLLKHTARRSDFVARYGGEEFVVILADCDRAGAIEAAERFRRAIEKADWKQPPVTASFGVSTLTPSTESRAQLIAEADAALYASKRAGRNRVAHHGQLSEEPEIDHGSLPA